MTKVLFVATGGLCKDGINISQINILKHINKENLIIDIVGTKSSSNEIIKQYEELGSKIIYLPNRKKNTIKYMISLYKKIKQEKYDVIHVCGSSSLMIIELFVAKLAGVKKRIAHSRNTTNDHKKIDKLLRPFFKITYNYPIACGKDAGDFLFGNNYKIIHNGRDLDKYKFNKETRKNMRKKFEINDEIVIGHVGNFNEQKNHDFIIDIFNEILKTNNNYKLILIGNGHLKEKIEQKIKELNIQKQIMLLGSINNVEEIIQMTDIMILPSLYEGLPNVVLEWQAAGLPSYISNTITKECKETDLVKFLSITDENATKKWANEISKTKILDNKERLEKSIYAQKELKKANYDIKDSANFIREIYIDKQKN